MVTDKRFYITEILTYQEERVEALIADSSSMDTYMKVMADIVKVGTGNDVKFALVEIDGKPTSQSL